MVKKNWLRSAVDYLNEYQSGKFEHLY